MAKVEIRWVGLPAQPSSFRPVQQYANLTVVTVFYTVSLPLAVYW